MASKVYFADLRTDVHENLQQKLTRTMSEKRNVKIQAVTTRITACIFYVPYSILFK